MKVTFDSNVWRIIVSPEKFPNEKSIEDFKKIRNAIDEKKILPFLCETVFTLEAIQTRDRKQFFSDYRAAISIDESEDASDRLKLSISIGPDLAAHPGNNSYLDSHLKDAIDIGFQIIKLPRFGGLVNPDIEKLFYEHENFESYHDKVFEAVRKIENHQAGIYHVKEIGNKYDSSWKKGIEKAPSHEEGNISKAIAEWADGDSVACHIAVGGKLFCTRDIAKKAGSKSIFSSDNLSWLRSSYGFEVVSPKDLAKLC